MLEYDRIDISEGIDINEINASKQCDICHYWYFWYLNNYIMKNSNLNEKYGSL